MSAARVGLLLRRELAGTLRARWFVAYALVFFLGGVVFAVLGTGQGLAGGGGRISLRALVGLMHLLLIVVPPMALLPAIATHADDEESGLLEYLLAQPLDSREVYLAKWIGASAGMVLALLSGLLPGVVAAVVRGAPAPVVLTLLGLTVLLGTAFASLGLALAASAGGRGRATAAALVAWLVLLVLGSLGLMAAFVRLGAPAELLLGWSLANPVEVFRLAVLSLVDPDLSLFGPTAHVLVERLGSAGLVAAAAACQLAWAAAAGGLGLAAFWRRG